MRCYSIITLWTDFKCKFYNPRCSLFHLFLHNLHGDWKLNRYHTHISLASWDGLK